MTRCNLRVRTRTRLIEEATRVFVKSGYRHATSRCICARAAANGAAINYHFGSKLSLYKAVIDHLTKNDDMPSGHRSSCKAQPARALSDFIKMAMGVTRDDTASAYRARLLVHELAHPTPGLGKAFNRLIGRPSKDLNEIVATLIGDSTESMRTSLCAQSVLGQIVHFKYSQPILKLLWPCVDGTEKLLSAHVSKFSLLALNSHGVRNKE